MQTKKTHLHLISAKASRKYRRTIACLSDTAKKDLERRKQSGAADPAQELSCLKTIKFKLEVPEGSKLPSFDRISQIYNALETIEKGSLSYLLFALILSGFRIFPNSSAAKTFASSSCYKDDQFASQIKEIFGEMVKNFIPSELESILKKGRRKNNKDWTEENIKRVLNSEFGRKNSEGSSALFDSFLSKFSQELFRKFDSWNEVNKKYLEAAELLDSMLASYGPFDSVCKMIGDSDSRNSLPDKSTIAFTNNAEITVDIESSVMPYMAIAALLREYRQSKSKAAPVAYVQSHLTTTNGNGLSWFFKFGLDLIRKAPVSSKQSTSDGSKSLQELFSVPDDKLDGLKFIKEACEALPEASLLCGEKGELLGYQDFRTSFAGHIDSWVANYVNRLFELIELVNQLPESIKLPSILTQKNHNLVASLGLQEAEVSHSLELFEGLVKNVRQTLKKLAGIDISSSPNEQDIKEFYAFSDVLNRLGSIRNQIENAVQTAKKDKIDLESAIEWKEWKKLKKLPKLNGLGGGVPKQQELLDKALESVKQIRHYQRIDFERGIQWAVNEHCLETVPKFLVDAENKKINKESSTDFAVKENAVRFLLEGIGAAARGKTDSVSKAVYDWFVVNNFLAKKDLNRYFINCQGCIYKPPYSKRRNLAFALRSDNKDTIEVVWEKFETFYKEISKEIEKFNIFSQEFQTFLHLENLRMKLLLRRIQKPIPAEMAFFSLPQEYYDSLPPNVAFLALNQEITPSEYITQFNLYSSFLNGNLILLRRSRSYLRAKFSWVGNSKLIYAAKEARLWKIPNAYWKSDEWKMILDSNVLVFDKAGNVLPAPTLKKVCEREGDLRLFYPLLRQLPHDWCYRNPFVKSVGREKNVIEVNKEGEPKVASALPGSLFRLIGPAPFKSLLDDCFFNPLDKDLRECMLIVDQEISQKVEAQKVETSLESCTYSIAVPIRYHLEEPKVSNQFENVLAIDQGEAGLAYAVFSLKSIGEAETKPIAVGTIRIPSIRRLIHSVSTYRKKKQRLQNFKQNYDSTAFIMRENVTGDVCAKIVGLMKEFNAFPVLEYDVKNLESGSRQLSAVYKAVNSHFLYFKEPGRDALRKQLWYGGDSWTIDGIEIVTRERKEDGKEGVEKIVPLKVFPGRSVSARFTSKTCSCCGRNVFDWLFTEKKAKTNKKFNVNSKGELTTADGVIQLFEADRSKGPKFYARRNERTPLTKPIAKGSYSLEEIERRVRTNLRRAPKSKQSRDTSQSQYFCVYKDCALHFSGMQADENAAINIGRRFLTALRKKSQE